MLSVIVPTLNAAAEWPRFATALLACIEPEQVLILDSESTDGTAELAREAGIAVYSIPGIEFNHGGPRQKGAEMLSDAEILVYLTQDSVLAGPDELRKLVSAFIGPKVAAALEDSPG